MLLLYQSLYEKLLNYSVWQLIWQERINLPYFLCIKITKEDFIISSNEMSETHDGLLVRIIKTIGWWMD